MGTTLFGGELAKLQKANKERASSLTVFPAPAASSQTNIAKPYTGGGRSFRKGGYSYRRGGLDRDQDRSAPSATTTKPSKSGKGQTDKYLKTLTNIRSRVMRVPHVVNIVVETGGVGIIRNSQNEGVLPPQLVPVRGRLYQFVEERKRITNNPYVLSIVAKGYRLRFTSPPILLKASWEIRSPILLQIIQIIHMTVGI